MSFYHSLVCNSDSENKNMLRFLDANSWKFRMVSDKWS